YRTSIEKDHLVDFSAPLPFDFPGPVRSFIKRINPKALFIARTDLWPEVLIQCERKKIPTILFSYYQSESKGVIARLLRKWLLTKITHVDCVNTETVRQIEKVVGKDQVSAFGDTRFDRVIERK